MAKYFLINVPGKRGYSIPIKATDDEDEDSVIDLAINHDMFECEEDAEYALVEEVTDDAHAIQSSDFIDLCE
jgi:hypothetical protein